MHGVDTMHDDNCVYIYADSLCVVVYFILQCKYERCNDVHIHMYKSLFLITQGEFTIKTREMYIHTCIVCFYMFCPVH